MESANAHNFDIPNEGQLNNLMEGCYVRIQSENGFCWVEIDDVSSIGLTGIIHAELEASACGLNDQSRICFTRDQVTHVGCNRLCFC